VTAETPSDLSGLRIDRDAPSTEPSPTRRIALWSAAAVVLLVAAFFIYRALHPPAVTVQVARAESMGSTPGGTAAEILTANGYVVARQRASVSTEVSGRLNRLLVEEGSRVKQGQVLGILQNADQRSALESARAAQSSSDAGLAEAEASAKEAALARGRSQQLHAKGLVSQSELDRVFLASGIAIAKNLDADEANCAGHAITINPQFLERLVTLDAQVHLHAGDDFLEHFRSERVLLHQTAQINRE